jgi:hypothetical protein
MRIRKKDNFYQVRPQCISATHLNFEDPPLEGDLTPKFSSKTPMQKKKNTQKQDAFPTLGHPYPSIFTNFHFQDPPEKSTQNQRFLRGKIIHYIKRRRDDVANQLTDKQNMHSFKWNTKDYKRVRQVKWNL